MPERRESEIDNAAGYFAIFAVLVVAVPLLWASLELLFFPTQIQPGGGRCWLRKVASARHAGYYLEYVLMILSFGSLVISRRIEYVWRWRVLVYGSAIGIACSLFILTSAQVGTDTLDVLTELECDAPTELDALTQISSDLKWYSGVAIVWFCGLIATQFKLKPPKPGEQGPIPPAEGADPS